MVCTPWFTAEALPCPEHSDSEAASGMVVQAIEWTFQVTGRQFPGLCQLSVRPPIRCHRCGGPGCAGCGCAQRPIDLTRYVPGPIVSIDELRVADAVLVEGTDYALDANRWLYPIIDGALSPLWPTQDLNREAGDERTWEIDLTFGAMPPPVVLGAAQELACQLIRKLTTGACDLPDHTTSVSSNGMTINFEVPKNGRTGIPRIDTVLDLYPSSTHRRIIDPAAERPRLRPL